MENDYDRINNVGHLIFAVLTTIVGILTFICSGKSSADLGKSFKLVSERLEAVYKGLGEMQNLATGVGDLKRALTNVKDRGTWAEVQLGAILEQILTVDQYEKNVCVKLGSAERMIKMQFKQLWNHELEQFEALQKIFMINT